MSRLRLQTFSLLVCATALATVAALAFRQPDNKPQGSDLQAAADRFKSVPASTLGVQEPISLLESNIYADGGSIYVRFHDANGTEFLAMRLSDFSHPPERCRNFLFGRAIPNPMEDLPELPPGSIEEQALCGLLIRWTNSIPEFSAIMSADREAYHTWYSRINSRAVSDDVTDEEWRKRHYQNWAFIFTRRLLQHAARF